MAMLLDGRQSFSMIETINHKHRQAAAKPAACAKPIMLSTLGSKGKRGGRVR